MLKLGSVAVFLLALAAAQRTPGPTELLEQYLAGNFDAAVQPLVRVSGAGRYAGGFVADAEAWIGKAATPEDAERRRMAAASLALEFAVVRMEDEWQTLRPLIEWACVQFRRGGAPGERERAWHRAALAAVQGARDTAFARRPPPPDNAEEVKKKDPLALLDHVSHAAARFPDDPVVQFAQAFFAEVNVPVEGRARMIDVDTAQRMSDRAIELYRLAAKEPLLAHDAQLAIGYIHLRMRRLDQVLPELESAAASTEPFLRYLAHLLRGRTFEQLGGVDKAADAYRSALQAIPNGQAAAFALAAIEHRADRPAEAIRITSESFAARPAEDPWREYGFGQFRRWTLWRDRMREAVK